MLGQVEERSNGNTYKWNGW